MIACPAEVGMKRRELIKGAALAAALPAARLGAMQMGPSAAASPAAGVDRIEHQELPLVLLRRPPSLTYGPGMHPADGGNWQPSIGSQELTVHGSASSQTSGVRL